MKFKVNDTVWVSNPKFSRVFPKAGTVQKVRQGNTKPYAVVFPGAPMVYVFKAGDLTKATK